MRFDLTGIDMKKEYKSSITKIFLCQESKQEGQAGPGSLT